MIVAEDGRVVGVSVEDGRYEFDVLMQSFDGNDIEAQVTVAVENGDSRPGFDMDDVGWMVAWQFWPVLRNRWVAAAAAGSAIAIESYATTKTRVYVFDDPDGNHDVTVRCLNDASKTFVLKIESDGKDRFIHIPEACETWTGWATMTAQNVEDDADAKAFAVRAKNAAKAAGWADAPSPVQAEFTGMLDRTGPLSYVLSSPDNIMINGSLATRRLQANEHIASTRIVRLSVESGTAYDYQLLMGSSNFATPSEVTAWVSYDEPSVRLDTVGWLYGWGTMPFVRNRWVSAAAAGTTLALEEFGNNKTRVYFIKKTGTQNVKVKCLGTTREATLTAEDRYFELIDCATMSWPPAEKTTSSDPTRKNFVDELNAAATKAGWTP